MGVIVVDKTCNSYDGATSAFTATGSGRQGEYLGVGRSDGCYSGR